MRALEIITGHVINSPAYTYKFQLKTTFIRYSIFYSFFVLFFSVLSNQLCKKVYVEHVYKGKSSRYPGSEVGK